MRRTIGEINERLKKGEALVLTAREVEELMAGGRESEVRSVDVVTCGTMGIMSGTYALLSFQICEPGAHRRFTDVNLDDVPAFVGPCPNESLGIIDVMVFATEESVGRHGHGGSFLIRELVEGAEVRVEAVSKEGTCVGTTLTIDDMPTAKLMSTRNCFRNYRAFVNPSSSEFSSIFSCRPFPPDYGGLAFSGCGHLNPLQNDPCLRTIGVGTKVLFNGGEGFIIGTGTRCSSKYPNVMTVAEMRGMDPTLMGGFITGAGLENLAAYAVPIPILDEDLLASVLTPDWEIPLSIGDIRDRHKIGQADYGQAWSGDEIIAVDGAKCTRCAECRAITVCPVHAIVWEGDCPAIDRSRCVNCGACVRACPLDCFVGDLGTVRAVMNGELRTVPIVCRSSNREGAVRTMNDLKRRMLDGTFTMTAKVADLHP